MKIIIEHGKKAREINGNFRIGGSKKDILLVYGAIKEQLDSIEDEKEGWISVAAQPEVEVPLVGWD